MQFRNNLLLCTFAAIASALGATEFANAETDMAKAVIAKAEKVVGKMKAACETDIKSFCSAVTPGEGRLMLCMMAHEDKISDKCFMTLLDVGSSVDLTISSVKRAAQVCAPEIGTLCADVEAGEGRIAQCLVKNKANLSEACSAEVAGVEARIKN